LKQLAVITALFLKEYGYAVDDVDDVIMMK
jgi:hypothetical protein